MKKISILAICFIVLAAFVYFYEIEGEEGRNKTKEMEESLFRLETDQILELVVEPAEKDSLRILKENEAWMLKKPIESLADSSTVDSFISSITSAKRDRTFDNPGSKLSEFGLENPGSRILVSTGDLTKELLIGSKDFTGDKIYVKFTDLSDVYLTSNSLTDSMAKELTDWRNKDAITFERGLVTSIEVLRGEEKIELSRQAEDWYLAHPIRESADEGTVDSLLSALEFADAVEFVEEDPVDLKKYGLDSPSVVVRIQEEGLDQWKQLELGNPENEESYFARDNRRSPVFTLKKDLFEVLSKSAWNYRDKDVVDVRQDEIAVMTIQGLEDDLKLRREDFKWIIELPEGLKEKEALAHKFWYPIDDIQFTSIEVGEVKIPENKIVISIETEDGSSKSFQFAQLGEDYLAVKVESGKWGKITQEDFEKLQIRAEDIIE